MRCAGVNLGGYRKGDQCGNEGRFQVRGKTYCHLHLATATREPSRFRAALDAYGRRLVRQEKARKAAEVASRQIDAFPTGTEGEDSCGGCGARYCVEDGHSCD